MKFHAGYCPRIKHQAINASSRLSTARTWLHPNRQHISSHVGRLLTDRGRESMFRKWERYSRLRKLRISLHFLRFTLECSVVTSEPGTGTKSPILTELLAKQASYVFCRKVAVTVSMPCACKSCEFHDILLCPAPFDGTEQTMTPNCLRPRLLYLSNYPALVGQWRPWPVRYYDRRPLLAAHG